ncbi:hypothetical protein C943_02593 [Mariniradius saccharolyticus AK6]|uniref:Uncharacterized protein n=1 Tax=Mariniradius saccharolyticus AK6 TaxID=1239962 RepID=M7X8V0_9BACT|nr:hypothetical protein [Mariniradius saccharolyticus]EMS31153.1 hypothetical protein C943_02593 [Mariniradius saccharolyticus AK6]
MKVDSLLDKIESSERSNKISIIEMIVDAVMSFPIQNLNDTDDYFHIVSSLLGKEEFTVNDLISYVDNLDLTLSESVIWEMASLNSLVHAFELMDKSGVTITEVKQRIEEL